MSLIKQKFNRDDKKISIKIYYYIDNHQEQRIYFEDEKKFDIFIQNNRKELFIETENEGKGKREDEEDLEGKKNQRLEEKKIGQKQEKVKAGEDK